MGADVGGDDPKRSTVYVNVIPMIDMLIILMVFLLSDFATSVFDEVKTLFAKMPVFAPQNPEDQPPPDEDPNKIKDLRVRLTKEEGYLVTITTGEGASLIAIPRKADGRLDCERLSEELYKVKNNYKEYEDALLEIDRGVQFQEIVDTMDAVREKVLTDSAGNIKRDADGKEMREEMFPSISLTDTGTT